MAERGGSSGRTQGYAGTWPPRTAAQAGGFAPSGFGAWSSFIERLRAWIRAEAGAGRLLPWVPVAFGTGIAFYFAADHEPVASVTAVAATAFGVAAFLLRRQKVFPIAVMIAAMAAGFATATWKTARIAHGVLARPMYSVSLSGFCRSPRYPRAHRSFCPAGFANGKPARTNNTGAGSAVGAQRHSTGGRQFCRVEGSAAAAADAVAARQLRFRPRHVFSGHRCVRCCDRRD